MPTKTEKPPFEFLPVRTYRPDGFTVDKKNQIVAANGTVIAKAVDRFHAEMIVDGLNRQVSADLMIRDTLKAAQEGFRKVWPLVSHYHLGGRREACKAGAQAVEIALTHLRFPEE